MTYDLLSKKYWYLAFSLVIIAPGLVSIILFGLRLGIDFAGGTLLELHFPNSPQAVTSSGIQQQAQSLVEVFSITRTQENTFLIRTRSLDSSQNQQLKDKLSEVFGQMEQIRSETIGPTIGIELAQKALVALAVALFAIVLYVAWAFRQVPQPASSWRFGVCAIVALFHDVLVVVGVFSLLGHFWKVEVDGLFITALLTIIGFSVHDTIVVFDRIRENLKKNIGMPFVQIANQSLLQTLGRSLTTSLTVVLVLSSLLIFGGGSIRWFVVALLVGIISGTYSSIFNATPLLTIWQERLKTRA